MPLRLPPQNERKAALPPMLLVLLARSARRSNAEPEQDPHLIVPVPQGLTGGTAIPPWGAVVMNKVTSHTKG